MIVQATLLMMCVERLNWCLFTWKWLLRTLYWICENTTKILVTELTYISRVETSRFVNSSAYVTTCMYVLRIST